MTKPQILMCPPDHYEVSFSINPWMDPDGWAANRAQNEARAHAEWQALKELYESLGASVHTYKGAEGLPDMVFAANCAFVFAGRAILARFRHPERQGEEAHYKSFFEGLRQEGIIERVVELPEGLFFEGAGDLVWDPARRTFWMGYGQRSSLEAEEIVEREFERPVRPLHLINDEYYHLDTALAPLSGGQVMYVPEAFDAKGIATLESVVGHHNLIPLSAEDARNFAANAVNWERNIILGKASPELRERLGGDGYKVLGAPMPAFLMGGGSVYCLTLRLDLH